MRLASRSCESVSAISCLMSSHDFSAHLRAMTLVSRARVEFFRGDPRRGTSPNALSRLGALPSRYRRKRAAAHTKLLRSRLLVNSLMRLRASALADSLLTDEPRVPQLFR